MTTVIAAIGATSLYLCFLWLGSAIAAQYLSDRKGYGEKPGLVTGLLLSVVAVLIWLAWPARKDSRWKLQGAFGRGDGRTVAQMRSDSTSREDGA